jgi:hypothetical protein
MCRLTYTFEAIGETGGAYGSWCIVIISARPTSEPVLRIQIITLWILAALHTAVGAYSLWFDIIPKFGEFVDLLKPIWSVVMSFSLLLSLTSPFAQGILGTNTRF